MRSQQGVPIHHIVDADDCDDGVDNVGDAADAAAADGDDGGDNVGDAADDDDGSGGCAGLIWNLRRQSQNVTLRPSHLHTL